MENALTILKNRLSKIGIEIEMSLNLPWIYLDRINGIRVRREDFTENHGFNLAWYPIREGEQICLAEDPKTIINLIRRYVRESKLTEMMKLDEEAGLYENPEDESKIN
jgi:hypothetical protein